jgi:hypothetical protein
MQINVIFSVVCGKRSVICLRTASSVERKFFSVFFTPFHAIFYYYPPFRECESEYFGVGVAVASSMEKYDAGEEEEREGVWK